MPTEKTERILRLKGVLERTGLSRSTLYRKIRERTFPRALRIFARCASWRESDAEAWLRNTETCPLLRLPRDSGLISGGVRASGRLRTSSSARGRTRAAGPTAAHRLPMTARGRPATGNISDWTVPTMRCGIFPAEDR